MSPIEQLQNVVQAVLPWETPLRVLEAGCGSTSHLNLPHKAHVVGIDISERQLARNSLLAEAILGDLQTHRWPPDSFDLVLCWDVLEHLPQPQEAVSRMMEGLRPGGVIVVALPNLFSLKGLITKFTPYWFHAFFYRYVIGDKRPAAQWDQFPTFLRYAGSPHQILEQARRAGLQVRHFKLYEGPVQEHMRRHHLWADLIFHSISMLSRLLSMGKMDLTHSDSMLVLQRPEQD